MKTNNDYLNLIKHAKNKEIQLTKKSYKEIQQIYKDVAKDLLIKSKKANKGSLSARWLKDYSKAIKRDLLEVNKILNNNIADKIKYSSKLPSSVQLDFFNLINPKYNLGMQQTFKNMFSKVPNEVIEELINGDIYEDGRGLSKRIWFANNKVNGDIKYIINKAIIEKKSAYELSKDIETYVNPQAKQDFKWKKVYPNVGDKKVDFNAQRLAKTSINHAYFMANVRSCERNPFVECMHWELSLQHSIRMHNKTDECDEYANSNEYGLGTGNFPINKLPLPHPQCLCSQYAVITDSLEEIGTRLNKWVNGANDNVLDEWFNKYGEEFAGEIKVNLTSRKEYKQTGGKYTKGDIEWELRRMDESDQYYNKIKLRKDDVLKIAKNTGWSIKSIQQIKNHIFYNEHILRDGEKGILDSDYSMSVAWQRLINGHYVSRDVLLLKHEYLESIIEKRYNISNLEAHRITEKTHDWYSKLIEEIGGLGEDDCLNELIRKE